MKRILFFLLALSMTLSCFSFSAFAAVGAEEPASGSASTGAPPSGEATPPQTPAQTESSPAFSDLRGHWAEQVLRRAEQDGYLHGYPDGTIRPDAPISKEEIVSILSRVLHTKPAAPSDGQAAASRADAFLLLDQSFLLSAGGKERSLAAYSDASSLTPDQRLAVEALLSCGALRGYEDNSLRPFAGLSRAELISLLYRILPASNASAGAKIFTGSSPVQDLGFSGTVYFDAAATDLDFTNVTADRVVILSALCPSITFRNTEIKTLVLLGGASLSLNLMNDSRVDSLILTGDQTRLSLLGPISQVEVLGKGNTLTVSSSLDTLVLKGSANEVKGTGSVKSASLFGTDQVLSLAAEQSSQIADRGIRDAGISLVSPKILPAGQLLTVTATLKNPEAKTCQVLWMVGERVVKEETLTVSPEGTSTQYLASFPYSKTMNTDFSIRLELHYTTREGEKQLRSETAQTKLENYPASYYDRYSPQNVLARVTTGYRGNYTLAWAKANDYDTATKEVWVNQKRYSSQTAYLIWINTTYQRVNVFMGSQGNFKLIKSCIVGTGRPGDDTPVGVYTVGTRSAVGWTTDTYNVRPVVRFKLGSGLAFHSRIYDPKHTRITDGSIGFPVSHGCIRMYDEDVNWIYQMIPQGTTVVVY